MKTSRVNFILKEILEDIKPSERDLQLIQNSVKQFEKEFEKRTKKLKINAEVFIGGSFAKNTLIKREHYDIDIFLRFHSKYKDIEITRLTEKIVRGFVGISLIHGSRDYFRIKINPRFSIELIPVIKIKSTKEARNITDLSYSHVNYIKRKIKDKRIIDDIKLAKAFCYANNCYGAESYVKGFSGYALELLVYHYGGFLNLLKNIAKNKEEKIIIDIEKYYKNKHEIIINLNSSKLQSPIILIDPTYKQRNVTAALSKETFERFKEACRKFLKNPSAKRFEIKKINFEHIKKQAENKKFEFILLEAETNRQEGDIAGSKLLKFYNHLFNEINKFFEIRNKGFEYTQKQTAKLFFAVKRRKERLITGPIADDIENVIKFRKRHKNTFKKNNKIYAKEKINFTLREFIREWKTKNKKKIREMAIIGLNVL